MRTFIFIILCLLIQFGCKDKTTDPLGEDCPPPPPPILGCPFKHVEVDDTTRQYVFWNGSMRQLTPSFIFVRFAEGTSDSIVSEVANRYNLQRRFHDAEVWVFCVPEGKRAEEFFTPYGKPQKQTFGNEELVEVSYAIFEDGSFGYLDEFLVQFDSTVTRASVDSINAIFNVVVNRTYIIADKRIYNLRVTKLAPYGSFDMANLYHCLKEVVNAAANTHGFNPPLGKKCFSPP